MTGARLNFSAFRSSVNITTVMQGLLKSVYGLSKSQTSNLDMSYEQQYHFTLLIDQYLRRNKFPADLIQSAYYFIRSVQNITRFKEIDLSALHADYLAKLADSEHTQKMNDILTNGTTADRAKITPFTELPARPIRPPAPCDGALVVVPDFVTHASIAQWAEKALLITQTFAEEAKADEEKEEEEEEEETKMKRSMVQCFRQSPALRPPPPARSAKRRRRRRLRILLCAECN